MKVYFHMSVEGFTNSYVVVNEKAKEALIIDPSRISYEMIQQIEGNGCKLTTVLITHSHFNHIRGLESICRLYDPIVYASNSELVKESSALLKGDGTIDVAGFQVDYYSVPGHSSDSLIFKIEQIIFSGDTLLACRIGQSNSKYSEKVLIDNLYSKFLATQSDLLVMPGHGPPTTLSCERNFNMMCGLLTKDTDSIFI